MRHRGLEGCVIVAWKVRVRLFWFVTQVNRRSEMMGRDGGRSLIVSFFVSVINS